MTLNSLEHHYQTRKKDSKKATRRSLFEPLLYKQENITLVDEVRKTGRGNRVWIEILKFLAVLTPINLIMVFAGEAIKAALFQKSVINEEISMIIQLYECALGIGLVVLYCCCIEKEIFI